VIANHPSDAMTRGGYREGAGRKSTWNNPETQLIRVPKLFAAQLLHLARQLDRGEPIEIVSSAAASKLDFVTESYDTEADHNSVTESYSPETLDQIAEEIVANRAIAQTDAERAVVRQVLAAFIARLEQ
jgi:hypothetical protein